MEYTTSRIVLSGTIDALENLITELVTDEEISYEEAIKRIYEALEKLS